MQPIQHATNNFVMNPAKGDEDRVVPLPCTIMKPKEGPQVIGVVSYWQPSPEQRRMISEGQPIRVMVVGGQPPMRVGVDGDISLSDWDIWKDAQGVIRRG